MKNFDLDLKREERSQRDRTFQIGGEHFVMRVGVRPEVLAAYDDLTEESTAVDGINVMDEVILSHIEDINGAHDRWRELRTRDDDPVTVDDLAALVEWLLAEQTGRPTQRPSASGRGPENPPTGTPSTVVSSPPAETEAQTA